MKILYVTTVSDTMGFFPEHIKMLVEKGHSVDLAFKIQEPIKEKYTRMGCKVHDISFSRSPLKNNLFLLVNRLRKIIKDNQYDIVHTHTPVASAIVRLSCKNLKNVEVIYTAHGFHFYDGAPCINWLSFYPVERFLSRYTDVLITINQEDYNRAQSFHSKKIEYVPGVGIDLNNIKVDKEKVTELKKELKIASTDFILCSIGELNQNKNHKIVLEALSKIDNKNIKYLIIGTGPLNDELSEKVKKFGLEKQVTLLGYRKDIYELLELSDVFVFPSYREGLSKALMEAMAMGKPLIASDIRGNRDLIDDNKGGILFDPTDSDQLLQSIMKMLEDGIFIKSASIYNKGKIKQFSLEKVLNEMYKIYQ